MPENQIKLAQPNPNDLKYRLRSSVHWLRKENQLILILDYPLKAIKLNPVWEPVLKRLGENDYVSFREVRKNAPNPNNSGMQVFLNDLVIRGYLERSGFLELEEFPFVSVIIPVKNRPLEIK